MVTVTPYIADFAQRARIDFPHMTIHIEWTSTSAGGDEPYATIGWWYGVLARQARGNIEKQPKRVRNGAKP